MPLLELYGMNMDIIELLKLEIFFSRWNHKRKNIWKFFDFLEKQ